MTHSLLGISASVGAGGKEEVNFAPGNRHPEVVRRLIEREAIPGHRLNATGDSSFHIATTARHLEVVELLPPRLDSRQVNMSSNGIHRTEPLIQDNMSVLSVQRLDEGLRAVYPIA